MPKALCGLFTGLLALTVGNASAQAATVFTLIADTGGPTFSHVYPPSINTAGTVAFLAFLDAGGTGIFAGAGGPTTAIALNSGPTFSGVVHFPRSTRLAQWPSIRPSTRAARASSPSRAGRRPPSP